MRKTKSEIYLHLVWATGDRRPLITPDIERAIHRCVESEAKRLGCDVLAIGGTDDHMHLVVKTPTRLSCARLAQQVKGVSSHFAHDQLSAQQGFYWQAGYGVFSLSRPDVDRVIAYVRDQKRHHQRDSIWLQWEESDDEGAEGGRE